MIVLAFLLNEDVQGVEAKKAYGLLAKYCMDCHGEDKQKADLNLHALLANGGPRAEDRRHWDSTLDMVELKEMPPENKAQPTPEEREQLVTYLDKLMDDLDRLAPDNVGRVTARRLNRVEYENTIRDLMGVSFQATESFPRDEVGYGFDNIGDVLTLSPLLMERYLEAAEEIVDRSILSTIPEWPPVNRIEETAMTWPEKYDEFIRVERDRYLGLFREGEASMTYTSEYGGDHRLRVRTYQDKAGSEAAILVVYVNGKLVEETNVTAQGDRPELVEIDVLLLKGANEIQVGYTNNFNSDGDRNLFVDYVDVQGPLNLERPSLLASHRNIIPGQPEPGQEEAVMQTIFQDFASRAYRRPATEQEALRLTKLGMMAFNDGLSFEEGIKLGVSAVLSSPHFLYRWELDPKRLPEEARGLNGYELASRLSYFLWTSMPDQVLFEVAADGSLTEPQVLRAQVQRMLADPKAEALVLNFVGQWLQIRNMETVEPDPEVFPQFDDTLRAAMRQETELFVQSIVKEDASVLRLLDADYTFLNERLAEHYEIDGVQGETFQRVILDRNSRRGGVLTQASILTITSDSTRTSPVNRGKWVLEQLLGTPPPPPPPDVEPLEEGDKKAAPTASLRERLEMHRAKPECAGCHAKMDPIGFALENFDAIGRWRDTDDGFPIDPSGTLTGGLKVEGPDDLKAALVSKEEFVEALCEKMLTYALGRGTEYYDAKAVLQIAKQLNSNDYRFSTLISAIVMSDPFRKRQLQKPTS